MAALNRPITAVTVSIITNILPPLHARENDTDPYTVKKIPGPNRRSRWSDDLVQQVSLLADPMLARRAAERFVYQSTLTSASARPLPISAVFRLRYVYRLVQERAARGLLADHCLSLGVRTVQW